ncbi:hypothetical protein PQX77_007771 [Marasmius sp. AFHP31]|nr:hypothetical protein PQX77_011764 [Marasmius sp. AFHP31]KAK1229199.1 hypothetical protein PQX77_007771 [Marasmius sp. AFHP31]
MAPKGGHRAALRPHSRTSSATKLNSNLQFTQKEPYSKHPEKPKLKNGYDGHTRPNASRVPSKDQIAPPIKRPAPAPATKSKPHFTIVGTGDEDGDEDEWISSESGVTTPNPLNSSGSEDELDTVAAGATPVETRRNPLHHERTSQAPSKKKPDTNYNGQLRAETPVPRVDTLRVAGFDSHTTPPETSTAPQGHHHSPSLVSESRAGVPAFSTTPTNSTSQPVKHAEKPEKIRTESMVPTAQFESSSLDARPTVPRPSTKRQASTRPPSTYSISSKVDHSVLRPHPLIRGQSFGQPSTPTRSTPLAPLTTSDAASIKPSSSPPNSLKSLASPSTISASPTSPYPQSATVTSHPRRTSVSSARSVATLPVPSSVREPTKSSRDRNRTLSTISQSSSSAAISSLAHLPTVTRPPTPQMISFFPPINTLHTVEGIHQLLPPPYLANHLTVLAHRTPLRESYDRVLKAKAGR